MVKRLYALLAVLFALLVLTGFSLWYYYEKQPKDLTVSFLDVGQGDAILIQTPEKQNILIDGGPDNTIINRLGERLSWFDNDIDLMVLTHPHDDHVGGLVSVLKRCRVKQIVYTGVIHGSPGYLEWLQLIKDQKIPLTLIDRPQTIILGKDLKLQIINPKETVVAKEVKNLNNSSISGILTYENINFFLGGDIEEEIEKELIKNKKITQVNIAKANHHGSDSSNSDEMLDALKPELTIIQVGKNNQFKHPSLRTLKRLGRIKSKILRNDIDGTINIKTNGEKYWIEDKK